jgi:hypothetical protein
MMLDYDKSQKLMLAKEAAYMEELQAIPGVNVEAIAAMVALYRAGWRDCWMEEAKARFKETTDIVDKIEAEDAKGVWADVQ